METTQLKRFATEARNILKQGVINKIAALGFDADGNIDERNRPQLLQGKTLFNGTMYDESFYYKWNALQERIRIKGLKEVYEEAAYTWFNRLIAIRIMQKNGLIEPVLAYQNEMLRIPKIVSDARNGHIPDISQEEREMLRELLMDDSRTTEQFAVLIVAFCHSNPVIRNCFGGIAEYTELLLPNNILADGGFIDLLNHTGFITDEDYKQSELIGWLYQFYISEKKDDVFASFKNGKKAEAEDIPAATQIFTPNWIVKYMVQNTVGRIYLDNNPSSTLGNGWKYLVEAEKPREDSILRITELEKLTIADLGCGSGHILNEAFDLLYEIYVDEGYSRKQAVENIFRHNLTGVDIDTRAKQLATFALMLKACQKDASFLDCHIMPNVLDMPDEVNDLNRFFGVFMHDTDVHSPRILEAVKLCSQAHNLGSIMKFNLNEQDRKDLQFCVERWYEEHLTHPENNNDNDVKIAKLLLVLSEKYAALVMNPPYMGNGNMNAGLSKYVQDNYALGKSDLATVFVQVMKARTVAKGMYGYIIPPSWMFLSTFEALRKDLIDTQSIQSILHLSRGVFGADFGAVASVIKNHTDENAKGTYFRLVERTFQEFEQDHLRILFEKTLENPNFKYYFKDYTKDDPKLHHSDNGNRIFYSNVSQKNFEKIPGCPIGYWVSKKVIEAFKNENLISRFSIAHSGFSTGNNSLFIKLWHEIPLNEIGFGLETNQAFMESTYKFVPFTAGGGFRRWYGNIDSVVDWTHPDTMHRPRTTYMNLYYKPGITWNAITSGNISCRYYGKGFLFEHAAASLFVNVGQKYEIFLAYINTKVFQYILKILNPTLNNGAEVVSSVPILLPNDALLIPNIHENISISRSDWDAHETSWDFQKSELLAVIDHDVVMANVGFAIEQYRKKTGKELLIDPAWEPSSLEWCYAVYCGKWERLFFQLHENEEELNRQFIEIYGLQDELTPEVPLNEITILQQGEITIEDNEIKWHDDVIIKQFISYAVGCMLGRYRLDKPGLHIAHPNPTPEEVCTYEYNGATFTIDDDGIMPVMGSDCSFDDNAMLRFTEFLRITFGEEKLTENLNFVEACLGKSIESYFKKDFWKDHTKMYQKRPIYWLFSSQRGAFQVLAYMHRMNPFTVQQIRNKYLLPHIEYLSNRIIEMELDAAALSTTQRRDLERFRRELDECREYDERLHYVADQQISFDLDDGVVVNYKKFGDVVAKVK